MVIIYALYGDKQGEQVFQLSTAAHDGTRTTFREGREQSMHAAASLGERDSYSAILRRYE